MAIENAIQPIIWFGEWLNAREGLAAWAQAFATVPVLAFTAWQTFKAERERRERGAAHIRMMVRALDDYQTLVRQTFDSWKKLARPRARDFASGLIATRAYEKLHRELTEALAAHIPRIEAVQAGHDGLSMADQINVILERIRDHNETYDLDTIVTSYLGNVEGCRDVLEDIAVSLIGARGRTSTRDYREFRKFRPPVTHHNQRNAPDGKAS